MASRVTLQMIAHRLKCGVATVSMALRGSPKISQATRDRVHAMANKMGYRPDPELGKLMHLLRTHRAKSFQSTLHAFSDRPAGQETYYLAETIRGIRQRGQQLGYSVVVEHIAPERRPAANLQGKLLSRGVEGLILLPMTELLACDDWLDWQKFATVSLHPGVISPEFDTIQSHWYMSIKLALRELARSGYRRIGAVINDQWDRMVDQRLSSAVLGHSRLPDAGLVRPHYFSVPDTKSRPTALTYDPAPVFPMPGLREWFEAEQPDVLLITGDLFVQSMLAELNLPTLRQVGVAVVGRRPDSPFAGIVHRPYDIGVTGVDMLDHKIKTGLKGPSLNPAAMKLKGYWVPAPFAIRPSLGSLRQAGPS